MAVTGLEITDRRPYAGGREFGETGAYDYLQGRMSFAVDPMDPHNRVIADLALAPRDAQGRVEFSCDFALLTPATPAVGGRLIFDVVNRGNKTVMGLNFGGPAQASDPEPRIGDGFLMRHGYSVVWCGWQPDVPDTPGLMRAYLPEALESGERIRGQAFIQFQPSKSTQVQLLSDAGHKPLPAADLADRGATLTVREYHDGPATAIARDEWQFARPDEDGRPRPDANFIYYPAGFRPGMVYEITYTTVGAPVMGLGLVVMRDSVSWLRHAPAAEGNPLAGRVAATYGHGRSLSGRYLREFLYDGLNEDEQGRQVLDGVLTVVGSSRRGEFNFRFAQPSTNIAHAPGNLFPFAYAPETDPVTGRTGGLLDRCASQGTTPKIIAVNSGMEYWWSGGSLQHIDPTGARDLDLPDGVRVYYYCGTQHAGGGLPLTDRMPDGFHTANLLNSVDTIPLLRASLLLLDRWVREGIEPPASNVPSVRDGTAVRREDLQPAFAKLPGVQFPRHLPRRPRLDFGPELENGIVRYPPAEGEDYSVLVSALDPDGNETGGVRAIDLRVPLATYMGWNVRHTDVGQAGEYVSSPLPGSTIPFARTKAERERSGDPRTSIEERYKDKEDYLARVGAAARGLVSERHLQPEDIAVIEREASERWDAFQALASASEQMARV